MISRVRDIRNESIFNKLYRGVVIEERGQEVVTPNRFSPKGSYRHLCIFLT